MPWESPQVELAKSGVIRGWRGLFFAAPRYMMIMYLEPKGADMGHNRDKEKKEKKKKAQHDLKEKRKLKKEKKQPQTSITLSRHSS